MRRDERPRWWATRGLLVVALTLAAAASVGCEQQQLEERNAALQKQLEQALVKNADLQAESDRLRIAVLAHTAEHSPQLLKQAQAQSKKHLPEDMDWFSLAPEDKQSMARAKASVFFFVWTWYERAIRKAMLKAVPDGIEVHDAVYSKMNVLISEIEAVIFESTDFRVQISKE